MPVVYNKETGLAENVDQVNSEQHEVPLIDPNGQIGSASFAEAPNLIKQGYKQPSSEHLQHILKNAEYESTSGQIKTGLEGAAEATTFGLSTDAEIAMGVKPEDIIGRREANPGVHAIGQAVGLGAGLLTGTGEAAILGKIGQGVEAAIGATTTLGRVGSMAAKAGIENMVFQGGDEASKLFAGDPNQSIETAMGSIGLSGVLGAGIGGGLGTASEMWKLGIAPKVEQTLHAIRARTGGVSEEIKNAAGVDVPVELDAALAGNQDAISKVQHLQESSSSSGEKVRAAVSQFRNDVADKLSQTLGSTPEEAINMSEADIGKNVKNNILEQLKSQVAPISKRYEEFEDKFESALLSGEHKANMTNKLSNLATEEGWLKMPGSPQLKALNRVIEELPLQENAKDLKKYITNLNDATKYESPEFNAIGKINKILREGQESAIEGELLKKEPTLFEEYKNTNKAYGEWRGKLGELGKQLSLGKVRKPSAFLEKLSELEPEKLLSRLSPSGDVNAQKLISEEYPNIRDAVRQYEMAKLMRRSAAKGEEVMSPTKFFSALDKLTPEMKKFIVTPEMEQSINSLRQLHEALPPTTNPSGTARTADAMFQKTVATATGVATGVMSHSGPIGFIVGYLTNLLGKEAPDAVRLAMLKFLASDVPVNAEGFKAAAQMAKHTLEGERMLDKATKNMLKDSNIVDFPTEKARELLRKQVETSIEKPEDLLSIGGQLGHYLPDHATALANATARNLSYLASLRPQVAQAAPLDSVLKVSKTDEAKYNRALDVAQNPMIVLQEVKNGTVTLDDIKHMKTMYPALYGRMTDKIMHAMIDAKAKDKSIPYKTKIGLSMFMGQPLESSMHQHSIQSNQQTFINMPQLQTQGQVKPPSATKMQNLNKLPSTYSTPGQTRERYRSTGHR